MLEAKNYIIGSEHLQSYHSASEFEYETFWKQNQ